MRRLFSSICFLLVRTHFRVAIGGPAAVGALLGLAFLLIADPWSLGSLLGAASPLVKGWSPGSFSIAGWLGFATVSNYMWQGKPIVWILFLPIALALSYRYLSRGNRSDLVWLVLLAIAGVGLSNPALFLIPAVIGCSWVAFLALALFEHKTGGGWTGLIRRGLSLAIPLVYPLGILILLALNIIPRPIDIRMLGPESMPWREAMDHVIGGAAEYLARHDPYDCCAAANCQREDWTLSLLVSLCCVAALLKSFARAMVDETLLRLLLFPTCVSVTITAAMRNVGSRRPPANAER